MIDNTRWLAGYRAFKSGEPIPWGDESGRAGWLTAQADEEHRQQGARNYDPR